MTTKFMVNGEEKTVEYLVNGIDISADFIGNTYHGMDEDDEGRYIASQEDYDWWVDTIARHEQMEALIAKYKETNNPDVVDRVVQGWIGVDIDVQPGQVQLGLEQAFGKL